MVWFGIHMRDGLLAGDVLSLKIRWLLGSFNQPIDWLDRILRILKKEKEKEKRRKRQQDDCIYY